MDIALDQPMTHGPMGLKAGRPKHAQEPICTLTNL